MTSLDPCVCEVHTNSLSAAASEAADDECDPHQNLATKKHIKHSYSFGYAATTSSITSAPAGKASTANAVRAGSGVTPRPGSHAE